MKSLRRILWTVLFIALITPLLGVVYLFTMVNPNDYKQEIAYWIHTHTQRQLEIHGDIQLHFFPWLGLQLGHTRLSQAPAFQTPQASPFASIDYVQLRLKLMPLLEKKVEMDTIVLKGLVLDLQRDAQGNSNWADLQQPSNNDESQKQSDLQLNLNGIQLEDARLNWTDASQATPETLLIENIFLKTNQLKLAQPIDVKTHLAIVNQHYQNQPIPIKHAELSAQVIFDGEKLTLLHSNLQLHTRQNHPIALTCKSLQFQLDSQDLDIKTCHAKALKQQLNITQLHFDKAQQINTDVDLKLNQIKPTLQQLDYLSLLPPQLQSLPLNSGRIQFKLQGKFSDILKINNAKITLDAHQLRWKNLLINLPQETLKLQQWQLTLFGLKANGDATLNHFNQPQVKTSLTVARFNPRKIWQQLAFLDLPPLKIHSANALTRLQLQTDVHWRTDDLQLTNLKINLDKSRLRGELRANKNFQQIEFELQVNQLNVDDYLPPSDPKKDKKASTTLPLAGLKQHHINGKLNVDKLTLSGLKLNNTQLKISSQP